MKTVYLDKNIYSYFLQDNMDSLYKELHDNLVNNSSKYLVLYSYAHIEDLLQSKVHEKNMKDLEMMESIAHKNYIYYDNEAKKIGAEYYSPKEIYDCQEDIMPLIDHLINCGSIDSLISENLRSSIEKLKVEWNNSNTASNIDETSKKLIEKIFPMNMGELSVNDILKETYKGLRAFTEDNKVYRGFRANNINNFNKGQFDIDPSTYTLTKDLSSTFLGKDLLELAFNSVKEQGDGNVYRFDLHITAYILLDMFGFNRDKEVKTNNLFVDAKHSYYGAHLDYVVSNDYGFIIKSRALYKLLDVNTKVLFPYEFAEEINKQLQSEQTDKYQFINRILSLSNELPIAEEYIQEDIPEQKVTVYDCNENFFYYFDSLIKISNPQSFNFILSKSFNRYQENRIFTEIIEKIVFKCIEIFGSDMENKGVLDIKKEHELLNNGEEYIIRLWQFDSKGIILKMSNRRIFMQIIPGDND